MKARGAVTVPTDVYLSFVSSLFENRGTLFTGMIVHILSFVIIYNKTDSLFYLYLPLAFMAVFVYRILSFRRFDKVDKAALSVDEISAWETRYVYGAATTATLLGIASGYAIFVLEDMFAAFMCIAVTMASMVSIVGRNYGSRMAVDLQTLGCCLPIIIACFLSRDIHMALMSLLLIPFGLTTRSMANGVREFLNENVIASHKLSIIAERFDTALNNMTHGLFMLDADKRIQVTNRKACELLKLGDHEQLIDRDLDVVLQFGGRDGLEDGSVPELIQRQMKQLIDGTLSRALIQFSGDMFLEFSASKRPDGSVVMIFEDVSARVGAERKILHMVRFDSLTGLPNRNYFEHLIRERIDSRRDDGPCALLMLDLDEFKHVNDMRGHVAGDRLLCAIAARIRDIIGDETIAGHLMGDQFIFFIDGRGSETDINRVISRLHDALRGTYVVDDMTFHSSISGGYVVLSSGDFRMDEWQIKADLAMFEAKSKAKGTICAFEREMDARYIESQKLKGALREAIASGGLTLLYQPMYTADGTQIDCCEALARWTHPEKGAIPPNIFIQMAEDMGLISDITRFVIEQACKDCASWPDDIGVSVNLSVQDLRNKDIIAMVMEALNRNGLSPSRLHLEITESCLMDEPLLVHSILCELRSKGITIAIDDFGTGFSSLSYLDTLPLDIVKIDRSFVRNIGEDARRLKLLRGTVHLARELDLKIVVEGVESEEQLALINKYHCADLVQGFVFAMPQPSSSVVALADSLSRRNRARTRREVVAPK